MKKVFVFSGLDKFDILEYKNLFFWNKYFQDEVYLAEKTIGLGSFIQKSILNLKFDSFYKDIEIAHLLFNISQVSLAKSVEDNVGKPDMLLTHSLGEISSAIYNQSIDYDFLWNFYKITMPYCRKMANLDNKNLIIFGEPNDLESFISTTKLNIMSRNSKTSALIWLGEREDIDKKLIKSFNLSSIQTKFLSYPIHTPLMAEVCDTGLKDLYKNQSFEKFKNLRVDSKYSYFSSTKYKLIHQNDFCSIDVISQTWADLCRTQMDLTKTYEMLKKHYANESFMNFIIEYSNTFISAIREIDPDGLHYSGLLTSTQKKIKLLGKEFLIQDLGLYLKIGDSIGFLK